MATLAQARAEIAAAVNGVAAVKCQPHYRQSVKRGDAFIRLANRARDASTIGYVDTWEVWVSIDQDVAAGETWLDQHSSEITDALAPVLWVTSITPVEIQISGTGNTNGVIFTGTREGE